MRRKANRAHVMIMKLMDQSLKKNPFRLYYIYIHRRVQWLLQAHEERKPKPYSISIDRG
jgi:hypothetical protein